MVDKIIKKNSMKKSKIAVSKLKSDELSRKKKKIRRKPLSIIHSGDISIGDVQLATTKLFGKKAFKKSKKKNLGNLEEAILKESTEDFWKSQDTLNEELEDSESNHYSPRKSAEEKDISNFYSSGVDSKYGVGTGSENFYQGKEIEILQPGSSPKSREKDSFDSSGNLISGSKKRKTSSQGVVTESFENPRDKMYSGERKSFEAERLMVTPDKLHDYDSVKKYK